MSNLIEVGARYEFTSGQYPEDLFAFQAVTLTDGAVVLSLSLSEGTNVFAETVLTVPQLAEFARSMAAALHQAYELDTASRYKWVTDWLKRGVVENPYGVEIRDGDGS